MTVTLSGTQAGAIAGSLIRYGCGALLLFAATLSLTASAGAHDISGSQIRTTQIAPSPAVRPVVADATRERAERATGCPVYELEAASPELGLVRDAQGAEREIHAGESLPCYGRIQRVDMEGMNWTVHTDHGTIR